MWFANYLNTFFSSPIATVIFSLGVLLTSLHIIVPAVLQVGVSLFNFWDRCENRKRNPYLAWLTKTDKADYREYGSRKYTLRQVKGMRSGDLSGSVSCNKDKYNEYWLWFADGRTLSKSGNDFDCYAYPSSLYATKEEAMQVGSVDGYMRDLAILVFGTGAATMLSWIADWLLFSYFMQTVVILLIVGSVWLALFGGRFVFDLNKKVEKVTAPTTEAKED